VASSNLERGLTAGALLLLHHPTAEKADGEEDDGADDAADCEVGVQHTSLTSGASASLHVEGLASDLDVGRHIGNWLGGLLRTRKGEAGRAGVAEVIRSCGVDRWR